jgi:NADH dehydrogenase
MTRRVVTVFGGSGFIGRTVVQKLAAQGWIVRVAVTDPVSAEFLMTEGGVGQIVPLRIDIRHPKSVAAALVGADAAVNAVGILTEGSSGAFQAIHIDGSANIAKACAAAGVKSLVQISALGASKDSTSSYARSKAEGETAVLAAFPSAVILRPSLVFGMDDDFFNRFAAMTLVLPILPVFTRDGPKITFNDGVLNVDLFGSGGPVFQPVWVGDVADAVVRTLGDSACAGKTYELGGAQRYSFKELLELILKETHRCSLLVPMPMWVAKLIAPVLKLLPGTPLTPDQVRLMETDNVVRGGKPGLAELGITPATLTDVVPAYLDRYRRRPS